MKQRIKQVYFPALLVVVAWLLLGFFLYNAFKNIQTMKTVYPVLSLRYSAGISHSKAEEAKQYALQNSSNQPFFPTFWKQETSAFTSELKEISALHTTVDGDAALAAPVTFKSGTYPAFASTNQCAVSSQLAWLLWGNTDVQGLSVAINNELYTVCGVYKDSKASAISSMGVKHLPLWQNVELHGTLEGDAKIEAEQFAAASGLGVPDAFINGSSLQAITSILLALPLLWFFALVANRLFHSFTANKPAKKEVTLFSVFLLLALVLPRLLAKLPGWVIPTKWSDFAHWGLVFSRMQNTVYEWFLLQPFLKDAFGKTVLLKQLFLAFCILLLGQWLWRKTCHKQASST